jgi:hypothetical protein
MRKIGVGLLLAVSTMVLAAAPAGWKTITDKKKTCQYSVPADWVQDTLITSSTTSADKKSSMVIHGNAQSLDQVKPMIQQMIPPDKVIEDNGKRYWYSYKHLSGGSDLQGTNWYVAVAVPNGICAAQVTMKDPGAEAIGKQIVDTISAAK